MPSGLMCDGSVPTRLASLSARTREQRPTCAWSALCNYGSACHGWPANASLLDSSTNTMAVHWTANNTLCDRISTIHCISSIIIVIVVVVFFCGCCHNYTLTDIWGLIMEGVLERLRNLSLGNSLWMKYLVWDACSLQFLVPHCYKLIIRLYW